jgi:tRNA(His) guanylyltransferase
MSQTDEFGDRMKLYESTEAGRRLMPLLPAVARLDGKCFSGFTRGLARPYDQRLTDLMVATTRYLVEQTGAKCGYTQSDEITLGWVARDFDQQIYFDGRIQKMASVMAAMASVFFVRRLAEAIPEKADKSPLFDCRVWNVPNRVEGANAFLWREQDATKNSILMTAHSLFSHREMFEKNTKILQEMIYERGINWNDYPASFKRGTYVQRRTTTRAFTPEELAALPPKHEARRNPGIVFERSDVVTLDMPPLSRVKNRAEVIFGGADPEATP